MGACSIRQDLLLQVFTTFANAGGSWDFVKVSLVADVAALLLRRSTKLNETLSPGLRPGVPLQAHTQEQKTLTWYSLFQVFFHPVLLDPSAFDHFYVRRSDGLWSFSVAALAAIPHIKGELTRPHAEKYLEHAGLLDVALPDWGSELNGQNSKLLLDAVNATEGDSSLGWGDIAKAVNGHLLGVHGFSPIDDREASASSCMAVRMAVVFLSGSTRGYGRREERKCAQSAIRRALVKFLSEKKVTAQKKRRGTHL